MNEFKPKLLVVDDEIDIREHLKLYFERRSYFVFTAASGEEAFSIIKEESPDIMLLDMHLPKMSGLDLLRLVREFNQVIKVIMVSGYGMGLEKDSQSQELNILEFMQKPVCLTELESAVKKALNLK